VNLALNIILVRVMGYRGLALGTAVAAMFNASLLLWLLSRRLSGLEGRRVAVAFIKILVASLVMGTAADWIEAWLHGPLPGTGLLAKAIRVFVSIGAGGLVLVACARVLRIQEFDEAFRRVLARFAPAAGH
jgi:putative peptidoglycan lipid II flippase